MSSFAMAFVISIIAGCASMGILISFAKRRPDLLPVGIMASAAVRLLLMVGGTALILLISKVDAIGFVIWVGVFYLVTLIWEIRFTLNIVKKLNL